MSEEGQRGYVALPFFDPVPRGRVFRAQRAKMPTNGTSFLEFTGVTRARHRVYPPVVHVAEKLLAYASHVAEMTCI